MRIQFHGAARTVTGSQHLIEVNATRLLLDCGLYQGRRAETYERNLNLPYEADSIDLLILSHAHIDHSGNIPNLVKSGFQGDIICTSATRDLCATMLLDSGHIQERDAEYVNKKRKRKGEPPIDPLYTQQDATASLDYFVTQAYSRRRQIAPGITLMLLDAGHMLGSAIVVLDIEDRDADCETRLVFSGDIGREGIPIIRDPETVEFADILIMESTYGNRTHIAYDAEADNLKRIIHEAHQRGGQIIIPAFSVGRTQQLVFMLNQLQAAGHIPSLPVYVDSPLAIDATAVFRLHPECYDDETRDFIMSDNGRRGPLSFPTLTYTRKVEDSKALNNLTEPAIIISASGMAEAGRILHHLKNNIEDPRTTVLIVGWQAPNTLGRKLVDGLPTVRIFGDEYQNNAHVEVMNGFSGHADRDELLDWVGAMQRKPQRTFLVHGEIDSAEALAADLNERFTMQVDIPELHQKYDI